MTELAVYLYQVHIGDLVGDSWRDFDFIASETGAQHFGVGSTVLSESVPLLPQPPRNRVTRRRNFFDELLPEGLARQRLAERVRLMTADTLGLLSAYGRDVAGAVQIVSLDAPDFEEAPRPRPLSNKEVAELINNLTLNPLGNAPISGKASLAGVQDKLLLAYEDRTWLQCLYGYPSTHILKPISQTYPDMIYNEEFVSRFMRALGLISYETRLAQFGGVDALVIERYDRDLAVPGRRIHQEDFNQVLGAAGSEKYQELGGKVSLERIASVLFGVQGVGSLVDLLRLVTLSVVVGNLDLHAKNISLLHPPNGGTVLAPSYDVVPLSHYAGVDGRVAMAVNDVYPHDQISRNDLVAEAVRWGLDEGLASETVDACLEVILKTNEKEKLPAEAFSGLRNQIRLRARELS